MDQRLEKCWSYLAVKDVSGEFIRSECASWWCCGKERVHVEDGTDEPWAKSLGGSDSYSYPASHPIFKSQANWVHHRQWTVD